MARASADFARGADRALADAERQQRRVHASAKRRRASPLSVSWNIDDDVPLGVSGRGSASGGLRRCGTPGCTLPDFHAGMHMGDAPISSKRPSVARSPGALSDALSPRAGGRPRSASPLQPPSAKRQVGAASSPLYPAGRAD